MPNRTVLLIEDDPNDEALSLRAFRQSGVPCTVVVAHSAKEALDFLLRADTFAGRTSPDPKVVFLDNSMPGTSGHELVRAIREEANLTTIPLVVVSGTKDQSVINRCFQAGANSFLEKPIDTHEYLTHLGKAARYWLSINLAPRSTSATSLL